MLDCNALRTSSQTLVANTARTESTSPRNFQNRKELGKVSKNEYWPGHSEKERQLLMNQVATLWRIPEPNLVPTDEGCNESGLPAIRMQEVTVWRVIGVLGVLTVISFYILWDKACGGTTTRFVLSATAPFKTGESIRSNIQP